MSNVSKTVRLPEELVQYVEQQKGLNFSDKLIRLLTDVLEGDSKRQQKIARYEEYIQKQENRLDDFYNLIRRTREASQCYERLLKQLQKEIDGSEITPGVSQ